MKTKEQIVSKEQKELAKWRRMKGQPTGKWYLQRMVAIVSVVYLLDALATDLHGGLQELEVNYFAKLMGLEYTEVLSIFAFVGILTLLINFLTPFYKALADKLGRKMLFMMSTAGMGLGLILGFLSTNLVIYMVGRTILTFFIIADIQVVYIMEVAPPEKRARLSALTKFFSILGILVIPLCRDLLLDASGSNWHIICLVPAIIAIITVVLIHFFVRESDVFLDQRIAYLEIPLEEREADAAKQKANKELNTNKGGIGTAFRYVFKDKRARPIVLCFFIFMSGMAAFVVYFNTICQMSGLNTKQITSALYIFPIMAAIVTLIAGFISDKLGRKALCVIYSLVALSALAAFIFTAGKVSPFITGGLYGTCYGAFWATGDTLQMMLAESTRTEIRSSVTAVNGLLSMGAAMFGTILFGTLMLKVDLVVLCLVVGTISMALMLLVLLTSTKETKGVDLSGIKEQN